MECLDLKMFHLKSLWTIQVELPGASLLCGGDLLKEGKDKINIWELSYIDASDSHVVGQDYRKREGRRRWLRTQRSSGLEGSLGRRLKKSSERWKPGESGVHGCLLCFMEVWLIYNAVLISAVQQTDSVIHMYIFVFIFFSIMVWHTMLNIVPSAVQQDLVV